MTTYSDDRSSRAERMSRLDQLEREIAIERDQLNSPDTDGEHNPGQERPSEERPAEGRPAGAGHAGSRAGSVRTVDLPELEERVTESQREAWALGYQAGVADSQTTTGRPTQNPFHPLRGL